jgi:hypothetical protein
MADSRIDSLCRLYGNTKPLAMHVSPEQVAIPLPKSKSAQPWSVTPLAQIPLAAQFYCAK